MGEVHTGPTDALPDEAVFALAAEHVLRAKGTVLIGRVECAELRPGDRVVAAVANRPVCRGVVSSVERFAQTLPAAPRGEEVAVLVRGWGEFLLPPGTRLFLLPRAIC